MDPYDAVVVGAGPAGGQCARELTAQGHTVLLIDKSKSFSENNYSSGGAPLEIMEAFQLPSSVVGTYWRTLRVFSSKEKATWEASEPLGPILDFDRLRAFLANETVKQGGICELGWQYVGHHLNSQNIDVQIKKTATQEIIHIPTKTLIDATGSERKVLSKTVPQSPEAMVATGIEYHIQVSPTVYESFSQSLNFFLGRHWMPQGYAWIFPMAPNQLKVGVIRYFQDERYMEYVASYRHYLDQLLTFCDPSQSFKIVDKHGKTISYALGQRDKRYQGPVVAIGDAISCINPLGCEGIRHALVSGRFAAQEVGRFLRQEIPDLNSYHQQMNRYFGRRWFYSEKLMASLFKTKQDGLIDYTVKSFSMMNQQEILDVIFHYRFSRTIKSYLKYFLYRLRSVFT